MYFYTNVVVDSHSCQSFVTFFFSNKKKEKKNDAFPQRFLLKVACKLYTGREMGPLFSMLLASGIVHHVQQGESKLFCCRGQD